MYINNTVVANFLTISYQMLGIMQWIFIGPKHNVITTKIQIDSEEKDGE